MKDDHLLLNFFLQLVAPYNKWAIASLFFFILSIILFAIEFIIEFYLPIYDGLLGVVLDIDNFDFLLFWSFLLSVYTALQGCYLIKKYGGKGILLCKTIL